MAKQWDFELDWADDEQETVAREEQEPSLPVVARPAVVVVERPAVETAVPFDPRRTIMGLGITEEANVTRPTPGGSRGGYPTTEELESYDRPTRPTVDQSALSALRKIVDEGGPATQVSVPPPRRVPAPPPRPVLAPASRPVPPSVVPYALPDRTTTRALAVSAPRARRTGSGAAVVIAVVAGLFAGIWFGAPREGELRVDVASAHGASVEKARVYVAGDLRCRRVPCVVGGLEPGFETVRIEVDGQRDILLRTAEITAGKEEMLSVRLPAPKLHGLRIVEMPGVTDVLVDGVRRGPPPLLLDELEPGEHHIQFDGGEGVEPSHRTVEIEEGTIVEIRDVKLQPIAPSEKPDVD